MPKPTFDLVAPLVLRSRARGDHVDVVFRCPVTKKEVASTGVAQAPADTSVQQRTRWNVRDSDGTLIISRTAELSGGSAYTARCAERLGKPWRHIHPGADSVENITGFLDQHRIRTLNVAGPRVSTDPGICEYVFAVLERLRGS